MLRNTYSGAFGGDGSKMAGSIFLGPGTFSHVFGWGTTYKKFRDVARKKKLIALVGRSVRGVQKIRATFDDDSGRLNYWEGPKQISLNIADEQTVVLPTQH